MAIWYYKNSNASGWNSINNWNAEAGGKGAKPSTIPWTTEDTKDDDLYIQGAYDPSIPIPLNVQVGSATNEWEITGTFLNTIGTVVVSVENTTGVVYGGVWNCSVTNSNYVYGGVFNSPVSNLLYIYGGIFNQAVTNSLRIYDGVFNEAVTNDASLYGGTFEDQVTNNSFIMEGTFNGEVINLQDIYGGVFNSPVSNTSANSDIYNGIFNGAVSNQSRVYNGIFNGYFTNLTGSSVVGGIFSGTLDNYTLIRGCILACSEYNKLVEGEDEGRLLACSYLSRGTMLFTSISGNACMITAKSGVEYPEDLPSITLSDVLGSGML